MAKLQNQLNVCSKIFRGTNSTLVCDFFTLTSYSFLAAVQGIDFNLQKFFLL